MTATIELNDRLVKKAKKLSGINDDKQLVDMVFKRYVHGEEACRALMKLKDSNIIDPDYDPKEGYR
jgi:Arc/MetJ family transcription regulator